MVKLSTRVQFKLMIGAALLAQALGSSSALAKQARPKDAAAPAPEVCVPVESGMRSSMDPSSSRRFPEVERLLSMEALRKIPDLDPEKFGSFFEDFEFEFLGPVQPHDTFLARKSGDCDDYATLAAQILGERGYATRLIAVRMKGETHVVCYIPKVQAYLDYNERKSPQKTVACGPDLRQIATSVAKSFGREPVGTYEFTYSEKKELNVKRLHGKIIQFDTSSGTPK